MVVLSPLLLWLNCVSPKFTLQPHSPIWLYLEIGPLMRWSGLNAVIRVGSQCPCKRKKRHQECGHREERPYEAQKEEGHLQAEREMPWKKPKLPTPWSWTFRLQNCEEINLCCLNHPVHGIALFIEKTSLMYLLHIFSLAHFMFQSLGSVLVSVVTLALICLWPCRCCLRVRSHTLGGWD